MASFKDNPVLAELDDIASELEKTGNVDLASLVDECSAELQSGTPKKAATKKRAPKKRAPKKRVKKNRKSAGVSNSRKRQKIAAAMKKIAKAQVSELEDIAAELIGEGEKHAALEVLRIAEDLDSDYDYSSEGDHASHNKSEGTGDADKRYDREKNLPKPKGDDPKMDYPFEEGEGYPFTDGSKSAFAKQLDDLIRLASDEESESPFGDDGDEDDLDGEEGDLDGEEGDLDGEEGDLDGEEGDLDGEEGDLEDASPFGDEEDMGDPEEAEDDDELAAMLEAMDDGDMTAADRMYEADDAEDDAGDLDLGGLDDEPAEEEDAFGEEGDLDGEEGDPIDDMGEDLGDEMSDDPTMDEAEDEEALLGFGAQIDTPLGGIHVGTANRKQVIALARKLHARGQTKLAKRVVSLIKKNK